MISLISHGNQWEINNKSMGMSVVGCIIKGYSIDRILRSNLVIWWDRMGYDFDITYKYSVIWGLSG